MKKKISGTIFLFVALTGIWFLVKSWVPADYALAGHDSGLALNAKDFLLTRLSSWDDRINFGVDNSPHFGSLILHAFDYFLAVLGGTNYAGNAFAVFFWLALVFGSAFFFAATIESGLRNKYFKFVFPVFVTFNFYLLQSIFILERAKYEIIAVLFIFLAFAYRVLLTKGTLVKPAIIFSFFFSLFNGGSWFGLPLYGGFLLTSLTLWLTVFFYSLKKKEFHLLRRLSLFYVFSFSFWLVLNAYSILPYSVTFTTSVYKEVVNDGVIRAGSEWLHYISRGSSFLNLFRLQGVPDWYADSFAPAPKHAYAGIYLSSPILIFLSFLFPVIAFASLFLAREKTTKYLVGLASFLLLASMFLSAGTNSPLGFIYDFLYQRVPFFSIFRSPYFKFGYVYIISFAFLLAFSLSQLANFLKKEWRRGLVVILILLSWISYHFVIFNPAKLFNWQEDKSTLVKIPAYIQDFNEWLHNQKTVEGRILLVPPLDSTWRADSYRWGYWSLSILPSVAFGKANFLSGDINLSKEERGWVDRLYSLLEEGNIDTFKKLASRLGVKYLLFRNDFESVNSQKYFISFLDLEKEGKMRLVNQFGEWALFALKDSSETPLIYAPTNFAAVSARHFYLAKDLVDTDYSRYLWFKLEDLPLANLARVVDSAFFNLPCASCQIENLAKHAQLPPATIFPNSPFYRIKEIYRGKKLASTSDKLSKLAFYLNFILTDLSEIKSMRSLNINNRFITSGLEGMYQYILDVKEMLADPGQLGDIFYVAARVFESFNPVQEYFRSMASPGNFWFEEKGIRDLVSKILWEINLIKKHFDPLIKQRVWRQEKLYNLDNLEEGKYRLMVDADSLPVSEKGLPIIPQKRVTANGQQIEFAPLLNSPKWYATNYFLKDKNLKEVVLSFPKLPNLYLPHGGQLLDFPDSQKGCLVGQISLFNKKKSYRFKVASKSSYKTLKLYINEIPGKSENFPASNIGKDISLAGADYPFEHIYTPSNNVINPVIYLCGDNLGIPKDVTVGVYEVFSPLMFAERELTGRIEEVPRINFRKISSTTFKISAAHNRGPFILVFNERFDPLWQLSSRQEGVIAAHFPVDGYANGWLLEGGRAYDLDLEYLPQRFFEYGLVISLFSLALISIIYLTISLKKRRL